MRDELSAEMSCMQVDRLLAHPLFFALFRFCICACAGIRIILSGQYELSVYRQAHSIIWMHLENSQGQQ
jgi:hypothetical protein